MRVTALLSAITAALLAKQCFWPRERKSLAQFILKLRVLSLWSVGVLGLYPHEHSLFVKFDPRFDLELSPSEWKLALPRSKAGPLCLSSLTWRQPELRGHLEHTFWAQEESPPGPAPQGLMLSKLSLLVSREQLSTCLSLWLFMCGLWVLVLLQNISMLAFIS